MVPLLWAALRRGQRDTATVALVLACFAIWGAAAGGPFARSSLNDVFMLVSMFVIGAALPSLALSAAVALRRQAEQRLRESEEGLRLALDAAQQAEEAMARLAAIVTSSSDAIIGTTLDGTVATWNEAAERLFGYSSEEMVGQPTRRLIPPNRQSEEDATLARVAAGGILESYETVRQHKSGGLLEVSVTVSPMRNSAGKVIGISKIARDITERKRAEEEMRETRSGSAGYSSTQARYRHHRSPRPHPILQSGLFSHTGLHRGRASRARFSRPHSHLGACHRHDRA